MEAIDLLLQRRSVPARNMVEPGPDAAALERILRAGTRVPDHGKLAPWRIQVLRKDGQRRIGDALAEIFARENADATEALITAHPADPHRPPLAVATLAPPEICWELGVAHAERGAGDGPVNPAARAFLALLMESRRVAAAA